MLKLEQITLLIQFTKFWNFMEREVAAHQRMKIRDWFEMGMGMESVPVSYGGCLSRATT